MLGWLLVGKIFEAEFQVFVILLWEKGGEAARVGGGVTDGVDGFSGVRFFFDGPVRTEHLPEHLPVFFPLLSSLPTTLHCKMWCPLPRNILSKTHTQQIDSLLEINP